MPRTLSYCGELVRSHDADRFFLSLFAPAKVREDLWALFAFNHEIAKTREVVSETALGLARLQWWREAIGKIYSGEVVEHEVLKVLASAIKKHDLPREEFDTLIYAREFDLEDVLPSNMDGFLHYADYTTTPLLKLAVKIAGGNPDYEPVQVVAVNYAIAGLLRAVPFHARQRRCYLPEDEMKAHGVTLRQLHDFLKPEAGLRDVVKAAAGHFVNDVKTGNRFLRAVNGLSRVYMKQLKRAGFDPFDARLAVPPYFKELRVYLSA